MLHVVTPTVGWVTEFELDMATHARIATSPFNCDWIEKGSQDCAGAFPYAICHRFGTGARVVSETECGRCQLWKESMDIRHEYGQQ